MVCTVDVCLVCMRGLAMLPPVKRAFFCALSGMRGQQGATQQLRHASHHTHNAFHVGASTGVIAFNPPAAHNAHPPALHYSPPALSVLDLSIKTEPPDPDLLFACEENFRKNSMHSFSPMGDKSRLKAKEKSKQYRQKQKIHRMTDSTYDMLFRHQVAERKRRQRMREKVNSAFNK